tara:strand:+ start:1578 stop:1892 length:315 start_codon:yes stop_codon:yes gene_type:complete
MNNISIFRAVALRSLIVAFGFTVLTHFIGQNPFEIGVSVELFIASLIVALFLHVLIFYIPAARVYNKCIKKDGCAEYFEETYGKNHAKYMFSDGVRQLNEKFGK